MENNTIYKIIFFILSIFSFTEIFYLKKIKKLRKYIVIFLWFFGSFSMIGKDILNYQAYYFKRADFIELGYKILNNFSYYLFDGKIEGFYFLIALWNGITLYLIYESFNEYTPYFYTAIFINYKWFFLGNILGGSRQGLVIAFFYWSLRFVNSSKRKKYFLNIFMYFCHRSSLILLPVYFFIKRRLKIKYIFIFLIFIVFFSTLYIQDYIEILLKIIPLPRRIAELLTGYLNTTLYNRRKEITIITIFVTCCILIPSLLYRKKLEKNKYFNTCLNIYLLYCFFQYGLTSFYVLSYRISEYFRNIDAILISLFLTIFKDKKIKIFIWIIIFSYNLISFNRYIQHPTYSTQIYKNFLIEVIKK